MNQLNNKKIIEVSFGVPPPAPAGTLSEASLPELPAPPLQRKWQELSALVKKPDFSAENMTEAQTAVNFLLQAISAASKYISGVERVEAVCLKQQLTALARLSGKKALTEFKNMGKFATDQYPCPPLLRYIELECPECLKDLLPPTDLEKFFQMTAQAQALLARVTAAGRSGKNAPKARVFWEELEKLNVTGAGMETLNKMFESVPDEYPHSARRAAAQKKIVRYDELLQQRLSPSGMKHYLEVVKRAFEELAEYYAPQPQYRQPE